MTRVVIGIALTFILVLSVSCDRDRCEPPFSFGAGPPYVPKEGPVKAEELNWYEVGIRTSSAGTIEDLQVSVQLPPELEVKNITQPERDPAVIVRKYQIEWKTNINPSDRKEFRFSFVSKTDWEKWSHPIEIDVSLSFTSNGECFNYPDGHYHKTITWSHKGYNDPAWEEPGRK